jgi:3-hydroxy-3-methylglutaryl CoA synthase
MTSFGITKFGAYVPRLRIERSIIAQAHEWMMPTLRNQAKGARAFMSWDEDAVTMAVEAARDCLGSTSREGIEAIAVASTTFPYADLQHASLIASAIRLHGDIGALDIGSSQRAGTSGLLQALKANKRSLFVASDAPLGKPASAQELSYGAGAAAFIVGTENVIARVLGVSSVTAPFVDHFRASGERYDYFWEERWIRDEGYGKIAPAAAKVALANSGIAIEQIDHFVMPSLQRGGANLVARTLGFDKPVASGFEDQIGYAGCAQALLMLAAVLETAGSGERILLLGFGQGADAIIFETTDALAGLVRNVASTERSPTG